ncbi:MAG: metallopeptidase family protein [Candidatus Saccharibacteria bacterium]
MFKISTQEFEQLVHNAVDNLPKVHKDKIMNVGFFVMDMPTLEQARAAKLKPGNMLLGLYEGVPLSERGGNLKLLPDTITLFQIPIEMTSNSKEQLIGQIKNTVWHEVAHYFGLDHEKIYSIQNRQ